MKMQEFRKLGSKKIAEHSQRFFKTGKGEYGEGDVFLGIRVPVIRKFAKENKELPLSKVKVLIKSKFHEERLLGLILLMNKYSATKDNKSRENLYKVYISSFKYINNWDLVDVTCPKVVGAHLIDKDRSILFEWAKSPHLWTRRIAMMSTWWFIRAGDCEDSLKIARVLLNDEHDLIHKVVGWMLREVYKKKPQLADDYLKKYYTKMPRTMLRYAVEKHPESTRKKYLQGMIQT